MKYGRIPDNAIVMMNSGWSKRYPDPVQVFNSNNTRDPSTFHFPGIDPELVQWLASYRDVVAMAVDVPSVDHGQSRLFKTHQTLGRFSILGVENVHNMGRLPPRGAIVVLGVIKLQDGSGGPARVLGLIDDRCECANTRPASHSPPASSSSSSSSAEVKRPPARRPPYARPAHGTWRTKVG